MSKHMVSLPPVSLFSIIWGNHHPEFFVNFLFSVLFNNFYYTYISPENKMPFILVALNFIKSMSYLKKPIILLRFIHVVSRCCIYSFIHYCSYIHCVNIHCWFIFSPMAGKLGSSQDFAFMNSAAINILEYDAIKVLRELFLFCFVLFLGLWTWE